jgi:hypothetical protein
MVFRIAPWTRKISRAITKEKKLYLFDYAGIDSPAAKFENMVALELFRAISNWNDLGLGNFSLHYLRNRDRQMAATNVGPATVPAGYFHFLHHAKSSSHCLGSSPDAVS